MPESAFDRLRGTGRWMKSCSFCQKTQDQVGRLIPGVGDVYICDECIRFYYQRLQEMAASAPQAEDT